jgi:HEPN domain-containing protein
MDAAKIKSVAKQWIDSSDKDFKTMNHLFKTKDYAWSLFVGHLVIEKLLKGYYVLRIGKDPPFTHNLLKISEMVGLDLSEENKFLLDLVSTFNLNARYDNEKREFYKRCNKIYTTARLKEIRKLRIWIKEQLLN